MHQIRQANPDEYQSILRLLGEAYGVSHDFFPRRYPTWWGERTDFSRIWLMVGDNRIESLVRVFPLKLVLGEVTVLVGGIGAVSTLPEARGQGHMHHVMYRAIEAMKEEFCLSILWGDRHRYRVFGYDNGGSCLQMRVNRRGIEKIGVKPIAPRTFYGEPETLTHIRVCHAKEEFRRERTEGEDALIYAKADLITWTGGEGDRFGYLAFGRGRDDVFVAEFGGHPQTVLGLAAAFFTRSSAENLKFIFAVRSAAPAEFWEVATGWSIEPAAKIKILHLGEAIRLFRPWLSANPDAANPDLGQRPEPEIVERLFGVGRPGAAPFFCWPLDRV